ncbi:hypothetical protein [Brachybacterium sp. p3-SID957]|uniref:hypothetical protein n=1 Tax=Brachybacterium sp. p3-SID957 TaxID=2916049 RepID=UPI0037BF845D
MDGDRARTVGPLIRADTRTGQAAHQQGVPGLRGTHPEGVHGSGGGGQCQVLVDPDRPGSALGAALGAHRGGAPQGDRARVLNRVQQVAGGVRAGGRAAAGAGLGGGNGGQRPRHR